MVYFEAFLKSILVERQPLLPQCDLLRYVYVNVELFLSFETNHYLLTISSSNTFSRIALFSSHGGNCSERKYISSLFSTIYFFHIQERISFCHFQLNLKTKHQYNISTTCIATVVATFSSRNKLQGMKMNRLKLGRPQFSQLCCLVRIGLYSLYCNIIPFKICQRGQQRISQLSNRSREKKTCWMMMLIDDCIPYFLYLKYM